MCCTYINPHTPKELDSTKFPARIYAVNEAGVQNGALTNVDKLQVLDSAFLSAADPLLSHAARKQKPTYLNVSLLVTNLHLKFCFYQTK